MIKVAVVWLFLLVTAAQAQEVIPGLIPRFYSIEAAVDLQVSPEVAHAEALNGADLSLLEPNPNTNIWSPSRKNIPEISLLSPSDRVQFVKELPSRSGQLRFTVRKQGGQELIIILSKKVHNFLLRRNILSKLGYASQPMSWVSDIKIDFVDSIDRDLFKEEMKDKLLAGTERWIRSENNLSMVLQDALVLTPETDIYNLALGLMSESVHQGRRVLRAPYIPLALVDATESINLMPWQAGRIVLNHIKLNHTQDLDTSYGTSIEDARWIARRLAKLGRKDFEEIVGLSYFPKAVEKLLVEKIIARRNDLIKLLGLENEFQDLPFTPGITFGKELIDGEIVQEFFDGYASRFSYGDPESPFSASELGSFALSRLQSQLIETALSKLNNLLGTNDKEDYLDKVRAIVENQGMFFPTQAVFIPTFHGSLLLSRDIITGSYLGTNNKVQLVDSLGFALDTGVLAGVEGLPIPVGIKAGAGLAFQRVYSHVKPVQSLKKSLKEPYRNLMVPMLLKKLGHKIDKISSVAGPEQEIMLQSIVSELKSSLQIGESFIITDSLVPKLFAEGQISVTQFMFLDPSLLKLHARIQMEKMMLTRFHFHRANEHTFHVYQDYGKKLKLMLSMKLKSYVPVVSFNARWSKASAETSFFPVSLHPRDASVEVLKALRQSLLSLNHDALEEIVKPHRVEHEIKEGGNTLQFLIFKRNKIGSDQAMSLTHSRGGDKKEIHRRYDAITSGTDVESYSTEAINEIISYVLKADFSLSQVQTLNPGFTLAGKAKNKIYTSEFEGGRLTTNYQRIFNGWKVKPKKLRRFIKDLNREVGAELFDPLSVLNTDSILLYQLQYTYSITQEGTDRLLITNESRLYDIVKRFSFHSQDESRLRRTSQYLVSGLSKISSVFRNDPLEGMKKYHHWLKNLQEQISVKGLEELVGKENIAYQGRIEGFRQGDENGDNAIFTHVFGELPLPLHASPTQKVIQNWGILEGELLASWMREVAI